MKKCSGLVSETSPVRNNGKVFTFVCQSARQRLQEIDHEYEMKIHRVVIDDKVAVEPTLTAPLKNYLRNAKLSSPFIKMFISARSW